MGKRATCLIVTADAQLGQDLESRAAFAGLVSVHVEAPGEALAHWHGATIVLVGADLVGPLADLRPTRRPHVLLVARSEPPEWTFRHGFELGCESAVELAAGAETWLDDYLAAAVDPHEGEGRVIGVLGATGGVGATTLACVLAQVAGRTSPSLIIDLDPHSVGSDQVLGLDDVDGARWDTFEGFSGRLSSASLRASLPRRDGVAALTFARWQPDPPAHSTVRDVVAAARRGHGTVVLDLPRSSSATLGTDLARECDEVLFVVRPTFTGIAGAIATLSTYADSANLALVLRRAPGAMNAQEACRVLGLDLRAELPQQRSLEEVVALGEGPAGRRGALVRVAKDLLAVGSLRRAA